jgi:hypothetical protein
MKNQKENLTYNLDLILLKSKNLATFVWTLHWPNNVSNSQMPMDMQI